MKLFPRANDKPAALKVKKRSSNTATVSPVAIGIAGLKAIVTFTGREACPNRFWGLHPNRICDLGFGAQSGFGVWGLEFGVEHFRVEGQGLNFQVKILKVVTVLPLGSEVEGEARLDERPEREP